MGFDLYIWYISYIFAEKNLDMNITASARAASRRKLIDIPEDVFRTLSIRATAMGTNLKKLIEDILIREANDMDDAEVYKYLASTRPEGKIMLSDAEQDEFERKMGIGKYRWRSNFLRSLLRQWKNCQVKSETQWLQLSMRLLIPIA